MHRPPCASLLSAASLLRSSWAPGATLRQGAERRRHVLHAMLRLRRLVRVVSRGRQRRRRRRPLWRQRGCAPVRLVGCGSAAQRPRGVRRGARWGYAPPGPHPPLRLHRAPGRPVFGDDAARFGCRSKALNARLLRRYLQVARHGARA